MDHSTTGVPSTVADRAPPVDDSDVQIIIDELEVAPLDGVRAFALVLVVLLAVYGFGSILMDVIT